MLQNDHVQYLGSPTFTNTVIYWWKSLPSHFKSVKNAI